MRAGLRIPPVYIYITPEHILGRQWVKTACQGDNLNTSISWRLQQILEKNFETVIFRYWSLVLYKKFLDKETFCFQCRLKIYIFLYTVALKLRLNPNFYICATVFVSLKHVYIYNVALKHVYKHIFRLLFVGSYQNECDANGSGSSCKKNKMYNLFKRNGPFPQTVYIYVHIQTNQNADYIYIGVNLAVLNTRKFKK